MALQAVFATLVVTMVPALVHSASLVSRNTEGLAISTVTPTPAKISAADQVDSAIKDMIDLEESLKDATDTELFLLQRRTRETVRFLEENREAIILRLQIEQDDGINLFDLLTEMNLGEEDSESESKEYSTEDYTLPSSIEAAIEQLKTIVHTDVIRRADSSENEINFF